MLRSAAIKPDPKELKQLDDGIAHTFVTIIKQSQSYGTKIGDAQENRREFASEAPP